MVPTNTPVTVTRRLADLLSSRMIRFAGVGVIGTVLNLGIMALLLGAGTHYLPAAIIATELTIVTNFLMQERVVFNGTQAQRPLYQRFLISFGFNNLETLARIPVLILLVEMLQVPGVLAQALTLAVAFLARFTFTSRFVYKSSPSTEVPVAPSLVPGALAPVDPVDPAEPVGVKIA
ncbi:GtrA family protein [Arthrobacter sp. RIT-PI-e]|uniref:GtrA family protein n=1 Tax=Arthrobacter sp. RIT-PI-e TaxID=1681197 RepID=UPI000675D618|nr:GtrA family protein [Arthrobacter sp. RIT-PI-e]